MALDRQDIERRDFPIGRRGYETEVVDAHLRRLADEVDELRRAQAQQPRAETLASAASEQVRAIVEAAETTASDIQRQADQQAQQTQAAAEGDAERTRSEAASQAREHVAKVSEATAVMLQRIDAMETELGSLLESLRTGANRVGADLALLQGNMGELRAAGAPGAAAAEPAPYEAPAAYDAPVAEPDYGEPEAPAEPEPYQAPEAEVAPEPDTYQAPEAEVAPADAGSPFGDTAPFEAPAPEPFGAPEPEPFGEAEPIPGPPVAEPAAPAGASDDTEGARLIALNMALNGTPRDETDRYLAENFNLADRQGLLDEVYSRVG